MENRINILWRMAKCRKAAKRMVAFIMAMALVGTFYPNAWYHVSRAQTDSDPFADAVVRSTDVTRQKEGNYLLGLKGTFLSGAQEALDKINEIRKEACEEGIMGLTESDYVPIKWSWDLEQIALIRAAEQSACPMLVHARPNEYEVDSSGQVTGSKWYDIESPNGVQANGECVAWSTAVLEGMVYSVELWYQEKEDYVNQTGGQTGHYEALINPKNTYVGIGTFVSDYAEWKLTSVAEFKRTSEMLNTEIGIKQDQKVIQTIEMAPGYLSEPIILSKKGLKDREAIFTGDQKQYELAYSLSDTTTKMIVLDNVSWYTSDDSIATVDENGTVTFIKAGNVTLSAETASGERAQLNIKVTQNNSTSTTTKIPLMTTQKPITESTTTERITTTQAAATTEEATTTTEPVPTTEESTTTEEVTTTTEPVTTTEEVTTTTESVTTIEKPTTTTEPVTTTEEATTTEEVTTTTEPVTTAEEVTTTTESVTTIEKPTTTLEATTEEATTTTEPVTTTEEATTTEEVTTTTEPVTTAEEVTTTTESVTTIEKPTTTTEPVTTTEEATTTTETLTTSKPATTERITTSQTTEKSSTAKNITVAKVKGLKLFSLKKGVAVFWKMQTDISGYQLQYSTKKNFKSAKTIKAGKQKTGCNIRHLIRKKKYYIRIRAYKKYRTQNGKLQIKYGKWTEKSKSAK